jgi:hypothetical protein
LPGDTPSTPDYFSPDYFTARERFIAACGARGFAHQSLAIDAPSTCEKLLTIDVAVAGDASPESALILSSGIHGVEGFFGSAVQLAFLDSLAPDWQPPAAAAVILLHALNPYGFAWRRRFNEENVDLNRNFLLGDESYSGAPPLTARFRNLLTPSGYHRRFGFWTARMALLAARHGIGAFWRTLPVGQYDYPEFLYFGGHKRSQTADQLEKLLPSLVGSAKEVVHLDFHTGLGRWANCDLLLGERERQGTVAWWRKNFDGFPVKEAVMTDSSYVIRGGFGGWLQAQFPECDYRYAVAEFGTYSPRRVTQSLAEELRWHMRLGNQSPDHWARHQLADTFVPRDPRWRSTALQTGLSLSKRAADALWH